MNVNARVARQARTEVEVDARGLDWGKGAKDGQGSVRCGAAGLLSLGYLVL